MTAKHATALDRLRVIDHPTSAQVGGMVEAGDMPLAEGMLMAIEGLTEQARVKDRAIERLSEELPSPAFTTARELGLPSACILVKESEAGPVKLEISIAEKDDPRGEVRGAVGQAIRDLQTTVQGEPPTPGTYLIRAMIYVLEQHGFAVSVAGIAPELIYLEDEPEEFDDGEEPLRS